jgi:hypothetical protein
VLSAKTPAAEFPEKVESVAVAVTPDLACIPFTLPLSPTLSSVTLAGVAAAATAFTPSSRVVSNYTVSYVQLEAIGIGGGDAVTREPKDYAVFDIDGLAWIMFIPCIPLQNPSMEIPRIVITSVLAAFMMMPVVREARIEANVPVPSSVIDLVIVTAQSHLDPTHRFHHMEQSWKWLLPKSYMVQFDCRG